MSSESAPNRRPEVGYSSGTPWPDQIWIDHATGEKETRTPQQAKYTFGDPKWPIAPYRDLIIDTISHNPVTVLSSGTGTGKSIFVPQAAYESDNFDKVFITQPRIVATRENTEFIKFQMEQAAGRDMADTVAYRTATEGDELLDSHRIRQHTDGYMIPGMLSNKPVVTPESLLIIDEAHERNPNIDITIALAHTLGLKLLIQSATFDAERVARYCSQARGGIDVPVIQIPGVMHPIQHLEGGEMHEEINKYKALDPENPLNIMAFVPGRHESEEMMSRTAGGRNARGYTTLKLNGDQTIAEQRRSFNAYPNGKAIISSIIGRQSITVPDLDVVIDGGYERTGDYHLGVKALRIKPSSSAGIIQAKGRVGRTKPGIFVEAQLPGYPPIPKDADGNRIIDTFDKPPIQSTDPAPYALRLAKAGRRLDTIGLQDEPMLDEIQYAHHKLVRLGAQVLNADTLTEIGKQMVELPLDPTYARMLVEARRYGKNVEMQMAAMVSACQNDGITMTEAGSEQWRKLSKEHRSDMLVQLDVMAQGIWMNSDELARNNIVEQRLNKAMRLYSRLCEDSGYGPMDLKVPTESERQKLIGCIIAGCDMLFVSRGSDMYSNGAGFTGRLAKSTSIQTGEQLVVGSALTLEHYRNKILKSHNVITHATVVTAEQLEKYAPWRCDYDNESLVVDSKGHVEQAREIYFDGKPLQQETSRQTEPSIETTRALLEKLFHDPEPVKNMSEKTKAIYDEVARLRDLLVHRSDNDEYLEGLLRTISDSITTMRDVKVKNMYALANVLHERGAYKWLKMTISEGSKEAKEIMDESPDDIQIDIDGTTVIVPVTYKDNKAILDIPLQHAKYLEGVEALLGDRHIYVWVDGSHKNQLTLHKAIEKSEAGNRNKRREKKPRQDSGASVKNLQQAFIDQNARVNRQ